MPSAAVVDGQEEGGSRRRRSSSRRTTLSTPPPSTSAPAPPPSPKTHKAQVLIMLAHGVSMVDVGILRQIMEEFPDQITVETSSIERSHSQDPHADLSAPNKHVWSEQKLSIPFDLEIDRAFDYDWDAIVVPGGGV